MNPATMTLDQCRYWLAERQGWRISSSGTWARHVNPDGMETCCFVHPVRPTLDAISACMPEGWEWSKKTFRQWTAWTDQLDVNNQPYSRSTIVPDTGDEKLDRARLAVACWMRGDE